MLRKVLNRRKKYVEVETLHRLDGVVIPLAVRWEDGRRFDVRRIISIARMPKRGAGGGDIRYRVVISGKETNLHYEPPLWFVDAKVYGAPVEVDAGYDDARDGGRTFGRGGR